MVETHPQSDGAAHGHVFLGPSHARAERRTWAVIWLCAAMMALEIVGGALLGSIALVADGLHMSTHAGALLLAALAYGYARRHADDPRFTFGTGKFGDLAGFTSAIVLAMIALLIGYEAVMRLLAPTPIRFAEAIPIAALGLAVNVASAWLLASGGDHHHEHGHAHDDVHGHDHDEDRRIATPTGGLVLSVFETACPPVFRLRADGGPAPEAAGVTIETVRRDGARQTFAMVDRGGFLESVAAIPEPHAFAATLRVEGAAHALVFDEHDHAPHSPLHRDNNMRAALVHVAADAAVSVLVIVGLVLARAFGWLWMDPLAGLVGALVIANWSWGLVRDTGAILLDMTPDRTIESGMRAVIEADGDRVRDLHLWRLGPGHLGAILSVGTSRARDAAFYRSRLARFRSLSHVTIEIERAA